MHLHLSDEENKAKGEEETMVFTLAKNAYWFLDGGIRD